MSSSTTTPSSPSVALTRHTPRFAELATELEVACAERGVELEAGDSDEILNNQIAYVAKMRGVTGRVALRHLQAAAIGPLADDVVRIVSYLDEDPEPGHTGDADPQATGQVVSMASYRDRTAGRRGNTRSNHS